MKKLTNRRFGPAGSSCLLILFASSSFYLGSCKKSITAKTQGRQNIVTSLSTGLDASTDLLVDSVHVSSELWSKTALKDTNTSTIWSSVTYGTAAHTESVNYWFDGFHNINYVKAYPRYGTSGALGFPVKFDVYYSNGTSWVFSFSDTAFPTPKSDWVILPLPATVNANGITIVANQLGADDVGNYVFQLAEVTAGYDAGFDSFKILGNNNTMTRQNEIRNVGSGTFDPNKIGNWNYEYRSPLIAANSGGNSNIYAPSIVYNGAWNVYFGGWDGTTDGHDRMSVTVTSDNFLTFGSHVTVIDKGVMNHVNNESVIKKPDNTWLAYYTTLPVSSSLNKPGYATSTDGVSWTPNAGNASYLLSMSGFPNWSNTDDNGSNVLYLESSTYHLYFTDFNYVANGNAFAVHHATSTDAVNFTYTGDVLNEGLIAQDVKKFTYNSTSYYLMAMHLNGPNLYYSVGSSPASFAASQTLTTHQNSSDQYITSAGWVTNSNRLYGVLYGAGAVNTLDHNAIFAKWLQKKVIFINNANTQRWGDIEHGYGPDRIRMYMATDIETGRFYVYDTDGTTLLYTSPKVTMRSGDIWQYN